MDDLAQSLVEAAAEAARAAFFEALIGYIGQVGPDEVTFNPDDIAPVTRTGDPSLWEQVARAVLATAPGSGSAVARQALFDHADQLMASAADLYLAARKIREGR